MLPPNVLRTVTVPAVANTPAPLPPVPGAALPAKAPSVLAEEHDKRAVPTGPTSMVKDGETRLVEPRRVDAHKRAGWALA